MATPDSRFGLPAARLGLVMDHASAPCAALFAERRPPRSEGR